MAEAHEQGGNTLQLKLERSRWKVKMVYRNRIERDFQGSEEPEFQFYEKNGICTQYKMWRGIRGQKNPHLGQERVKGKNKEQEI